MPKRGRSLLTKNGTLAEAWTYDAYGRVDPWGYRYADFNRDGANDNDPDFYDAYSSSLTKTSPPIARTCHPSVETGCTRGDAFAVV